jgi:hypothetical protein
VGRAVGCGGRNQGLVSLGDGSFGSSAFVFWSSEGGGYSLAFYASDASVSIPILDPQDWYHEFTGSLVQPCVSGLHKHLRTWIYVSRGTGYRGPPMRVGAPAEITRIRQRTTN